MEIDTEKLSLAYKILMQYQWLIMSRMARIIPQPVSGTSLTRFNQFSFFVHWNCLALFLVLSGMMIPGRADTFGDFTYTSTNSSVAITGYIGPGGDVVIPDTIENKPITAVGRYAFSYDNRVIGVVMPDSVINIGASAFDGCTNLASIVLPNGITNIGSAAFRNCTNLPSINIPTNVTRLEDFLFTGCTSLTNVIIPDGVTYIGSCVFDHCVKISSLSIPNSVTNIVGVFGACRGLTFYGCRGLTNITLPDNIPILADMLFNGCSGLTKITIPRNVNRIGYCTFLNCTALKSIAIPAGVTNMGGQGFSGCSSLTSVFFEGDAPALVASDLFASATNVTVYYHAGTTGWSETFAGRPTALWVETDPRDFTYQDNGSSLTITGYTGSGGNVTIPDAIKGKPVVGIGNAAFANNTNLTSVIIPNSVTNIGSIIGGGAFSSCAALTNVTLPNGMKVIWDYTFQRCTNLTSVNIPDGVVTIREGAFDGCTALTNATIPSSVVHIRPFAFSGCDALRNLLIPDSVKEIMARAFQGCNGLTNVFVSKSVTSIEDSVFSDCASLKTISVDELNRNYASLDGVLFNKSQTRLIQFPAGRVGNYVIPNGITNIGNSAFFGSGSVPDITLPDSLTKIGDYAFWWCTNLTSLYFEGNAPTYVSGLAFRDATNLTVYYRAGTTGWGETFAGRPTALWIQTDPRDFTYQDNGSSLTITGYAGSGGNVTIPDAIEGKPVVGIGNAAFANNTNLTSVIIPNSVTNIGSIIGGGAFSSCAALTNVTLPNGMKVIWNYTFQRCTNLVSIIIPDGVEEIRDGAFDGCTALTSVTIPNSVTLIFSFAFSGCTALKDITIPEGVERILYCAFLASNGLTNVFISKSVTSIESGAFAGCDSLKSFSVDALNTRYSSVQGVLFNKSQTMLIQCPEGATGVYLIPGGITNIGSSAFFGCAGLTSITIPINLTIIGDKAFWWCTNLTGVYFEGNAPTSVSTNLFYNSTNVTVYYRAGTTGWGSTFAGRPTALWVEQPTYQDWARTSGLLDKFPDASGETDDADGDGMCNRAEMLAGTDPTSPSSTLKFETAPRPDDLTEADQTAIGPEQYALFFQTVPGKTYSIQSVSVFGGTWQTETNVTATTTQKRVVVNKPVDQGFYRVVLVP